MNAQKIHRLVFTSDRFFSEKLTKKFVARGEARQKNRKNRVDVILSFGKPWLEPVQEGGNDYPAWQPVPVADKPNYEKVLTDNSSPLS